MTKLARRVGAIAVALVIAFSTSLLNAGPAMAAAWPVNHNVAVEKNNGARISAPDTSGLTCAGNRPPLTPDAYVCWRPDGDDWFVKDNSADGHSATALWEDNACPTSACDTLNRQGECRNPYGAGTWVWCNKDYTEGHTMFFTAATTEGFDLVDQGLWFACPKQKSCHVLM
jgi:hypothetical protein